jgi:hypothetical protein
MTLGSIALTASVLVIFGVLIGYRLSKWQFEVQVRRQAAARLSLHRQLDALRAAREKKDYSASSYSGNPLRGFQQRAA